MNMFFTTLNSMQSLVKEKYNYWCDNRSLILYTFMLSEQVERATEDKNTELGVIFSNPFFQVER